MSWFVSGLVTGLVGSTLDSEGKPLFVGSPGAGAITDATSYSQWYRDVSGVNPSAPISLPMNVNPNTGIWTCQSNEVFHIDNQLFANEGAARNYHFTMEINGAFLYDSARANNLTFTGVDNAWVFVKGQIVVDLGGVHGPASQTVNQHSLAGSLGLTSGNTYDLDIFWAERFPTGSNVHIDSSFGVVPEPASIAALGLGTMIVARRHRRRV